MPAAKPAPAAPAPLEADFVAMLREISEERIRFHQTLGLKITEVTASTARASMAMQPHLIGHYVMQRIHGGAISAAMDALAGVAVMAALGAKYRDEPLDKRLQRFAKLSTIDLRVDYLRPGVGAAFTVQAQVLRLGGRVASTRMEFMAEDGTLLSTGAAAYIVS